MQHSRNKQQIHTSPKKTVSAGDTAISLNTPVPFQSSPWEVPKWQWVSWEAQNRSPYVIHEKFQFERGGGILGKLRTEVPKSSMRSFNLGGVTEVFVFLGSSEVPKSSMSSSNLGGVREVILGSSEPKSVSHP